VKNYFHIIQLLCTKYCVFVNSLKEPFVLLSFLTQPLPAKPVGCPAVKAA